MGVKTITYLETMPIPDPYLSKSMKPRLGEVQTLVWCKHLSPLTVMMSAGWDSAMIYPLGLSLLPPPPLG